MARNQSLLKLYPTTRNSQTLESFVDYCIAHPDERFWQALRNWAKWGFILVSPVHPHDIRNDLAHMPHDTFYWEGRNG